MDVWEPARTGVTAWDHNSWCHPLLIRSVPVGAHRVLDVGCGAGTLARKLAGSVPDVDGVDRSAEMIEAARRDAPPTVTFSVGDALSFDPPPGSYDAVLSSAVLHHLPLDEALPRMTGWLRPGGVLAAVALPRGDVPRELPVDLAAVVGHHALGLAFAAARPVTGATLHRHEATHDAMPVADGALTTRQTRAAAEAVLPGVRVRRLLFFRYLLVW